MTKIRQRKYLLAIAALVLVFAGCKGESPTSPSATPPGGGTGGVTPPTSASLTVTVSNATPLVDSTTVVTATVQVDNAPAPNGTAVEFKTTLGTFTDANAALTIRTTTSGVATATLTSSSAGTATITATVNNVAKSAQATFSLKPTTPTPPDLSPAITSISPAFGRPAGGEIITITGKNLVAPVRVLFDYGAGTTSKEAQVVSVSSTQIQVISPPVDLGTGQTKTATIVVINNAGSTNEVRITAGTTFTYQAAVLTPKVTDLSPSSGPIDGGTRVTIFGEGFQAPVHVQFGFISSNTWQDVQVINVTFNQIIIMTPTASSVAALGSGTIVGAVDLKITNVNSATTLQVEKPFRYTPKMQITAYGPTEGPYTGGTRVTIDGIGFADPVAIVIGGVAAMPIKVTGTQVIAITSGAAVTGCAEPKGVTSITNVDNGDTAAGVDFTYRVPKPAILSVSSPNTLGGSVTVTVLNASGVPRLTLKDIDVSIVSSTVNADGTTTFTANIPTTLTLDTVACSGVAGATAPIPTAFDVTYTSLTTGCTSKMTKGAIVNPQPTPTLTLLPGTFTPFTAVITPAVAPTVGPPPTPGTPASVKPSSSQTVNVVNTGFAPMTGVTMTNPGVGGCANFAIVSPSTQSLNSCDIFPVIAIYNGKTVAGSDTCTITISTTNAGTKSLTLIGTSQ